MSLCEATVKLTEAAAADVAAVFDHYHGQIFEW